jgi:hypothetical protein
MNVFSVKDRILTFFIFVTFMCRYDRLMSPSDTSGLDKERLKTDLLALGLLALVVFVGLSFLSYDPADPPSTLVFPVRQAPTNICGEVGAALHFILASGWASESGLFSRH